MDFFATSFGSSLTAMSSVAGVLALMIGFYRWWKFGERLSAPALVTTFSSFLSLIFGAMLLSWAWLEPSLQAEFEPMIFKSIPVLGVLLLCFAINTLWDLLTRPGGGQGAPPTRPSDVPGDPGDNGS